jgi:hypothetical protein
MSVPHSNCRCVEQRPATSVSEKQSSRDPVKMFTHSPNEPHESRTGRPTFTEDFLLEHTRFGQQADSIELAGCF